MGKKINPKVFRLNQTRTWDSVWFSSKGNYSKFLQQDIQIKNYLAKKLLNSFVSQVNIERTNKDINVIIHSARPGMIIGKGGLGIETMRKDLSRQFIKNKNISVKVNIKEVGNPNLDAALLAQSIKFDLEKRIPFRRALKQALSKAERAGCKGVKARVSGRLNGVEIARSEKLISGKIPLHTLRADIDYGEARAETLYGAIGIKVWVYKGEVFEKEAGKAKNKE